MTQTVNDVFIDRDAEYRLAGDIVEMHPFGSGRWRILGRINGATRSFMKFERAPHGIHKATDSFSLPYSLLMWLKDKHIAGITVVYENLHYRTSVTKWLEKGFFLYFKGKSEKKSYLKRSDF